MNPRFKQGLNRLSFLKKGALYLPIALIALVAVVAIGLSLLPLDKYRLQAISEIKSALQAEKVEIARLEWSLSLKNLSLGLKAKDLNIENARSFSKLQIPNLRISVQPLKIIFGRLPLFIEANEPRGLYRLPPVSASNSAESPRMSKYLRYLRMQIVSRHGEWGLDPALFGAAAKDSVAKLEDVDVAITASGIPGSFSIDLEAKVSSDLNAGKVIIQGPVSAHSNGFFQLADGRPIGVKLENLEVNLNELNIAMGKWIEKTKAQRLELKSDAQIFLDSKGAFSSLELSDSHLAYDEINIELGASVSPTKGVQAKWVLGRSTVNNLHLPLAEVRKYPMRGLIETNGTLNFPRNAPLQGSWKIALNNVSVDAGALDAVSEKSSSGEIKFSLTSEGAVNEGTFESPRTEFQLEGSKAQLALFDGRFVKPAGDVLEILFKSTLHKDTLTVAKSRLNLHTLKVDGAGTLQNFSKLNQAGKTAILKFALNSNRIELSHWGNYLGGLRKAPALEGFAELNAGVEGPISFLSDNLFAGLSWRVDRLNLSSLRGTLYNSGTPSNVSNWDLGGRFSASFLLQGHGVGFRVDRATLLTQADLSKMSIRYKDEFKKEAGVPLTLEVSADQNRNQLNIRRGRFQFDSLDLGIGGTIQQGSKRGSLDLVMARPVRLGDWQKFMLKEQEIPVAGEIQWKGRLGFNRTSSAEKALDWRALSLDGNLSIQKLSGIFGGFKSPLRNGNGRLLFQPTGVSVPNFRFGLGKSEIALSGEVFAPGNGRSAKKQMTLADLSKQQKWELNAQVSVDHFDPANFSGQSAGAEIPFDAQIKKLLSEPLISQSHARLTLEVGNGAFALLPYRKLKLRARWEDGFFRVAPFSVESLGGTVSGSLSVDVNPFYQRKDEPQIAGTLKLSGIDAKAAAHAFKPEFEKLIAGRLHSKLQLSTQGFSAERMIEKAKGRLEGDMRNGSFESFAMLQSSLDSFISNSAARDYLLQQAHKEKCIQRSFNAHIDAQVREGGLNLEQGRFNFSTGSAVEMKGSLEKNLALKMSGNFLAGEGCIGGDVRSCLAEGDGLAAIPFKMSGAANAPQVSLDSSTLASKITACMTRKIAEKAQQAIRDEASKAVNNIQDQAREKLKKIFR